MFGSDTRTSSFVKSMSVTTEPTLMVEKTSCAVPIEVDEGKTAVCVIVENRTVGAEESRDNGNVELVNTGTNLE